MFAAEVAEAKAMARRSSSELAALAWPRAWWRGRPRRRCAAGWPEDAINRGGFGRGPSTALRNQPADSGRVAAQPGGAAVTTAPCRHRLIATALLAAYDNNFVPVGIFIMVVAVIALVAISFAKDKRGVDLDA